MGLQDRDYMYERRRRDGRPFSPPKAARTSTLAIILVFTVGLFALYKGSDWWLDHQAAQLQRPIVAPVASPTELPREVSTRPNQRSAYPVYPAIQVPPSPETERRIIKCVRGGSTSYSDADCPVGESPHTVASQPDLRVTTTPVTTPRDALVTIYLCKAYSGGSFWSSSHCNLHSALIDRMVSVPSTLPFDQQVALAESEANAMRAQTAAQNQERSRLRRCEALQAERDTIWSRYSNRQLQPPDVIGRDRSRTLGIQAEQQRLGCPTQ
ncbi:MAG: hypothetical protein ABI040_08810 [Rhodoferax sp.]